MTRILFLCTGNICRSPIAEAFLRLRAAEAGVDVEVGSAGLGWDGAEADPAAQAVIRAYGGDLAGHRSRKVSRELLRQPDVILGMAREHVREAVMLDPAVWPRTFTLKELVRAARRVGPREPGQPFGIWLERLHAGRRKADLMGRSDADDVADPLGHSDGAFRACATELAGLVDELVRYVWGSASGR